MNLSEHVTLKEATKSQTAVRLGIDNTPTPAHLENGKKLCEHIFEPLRAGLGDHPIFISNGYRSPKLNAAIPGSSASSFHCTFEALDLDDTYGYATNKEIFMFILNNLEYAELVWEYGDDENPDWVHVAYSEGRNVKETLRCRMIDGKRVYTKFDINEIK